MAVLFYALAGLVAWWVVGCGVLAWVDRDGRLLDWVKSGPWFTWPLVVTLWPVTVWKFRQQP